MTEIASSIVRVVGNVARAFIGQNIHQSRIRAEEARICSKERVKMRAIAARTEIRLAQIQADAKKAKLDLCEKLALFTLVGVITVAALRRV